MSDKNTSRDALSSPSADVPPTARALWLGGGVALWALYAFIFINTQSSPPLVAARDALANVLPLLLLAMMTHSLLRDQVMKLSVSRQMAAHVILAVVFATFWYAGILIMLAFFGGLKTGVFVVRGFSGPAFTWQVFQGLVLYVAVAATCYAIRGGRVAANLTIVDDTAPRMERYLTKVGEEMTPVRVRDIVLIEGAQDYAEVATLSGRHLVRLSLAEFEARLDSGRFLRVHRSTIINFDHLLRAEPAGNGRLTLHLRNGDSVTSSRTGAQLLRSFMV
jgi:two-component system, LytTR family, response regulator